MVSLYQSNFRKQLVYSHSKLYIWQDGVNMKEMNFIIKITNFDAGYILNGLWRQVRIWGRPVLNLAYKQMIYYFVTTYSALGIRNGKSWRTLRLQNPVTLTFNIILTYASHLCGTRTWTAWNCSRNVIMFHYPWYHWYQYVVTSIYPSLWKWAAKHPKNWFLSFKMGLGILNDTTNPSLHMIFVQDMKEAISKTNFCIEKSHGWSAWWLHMHFVQWWSYDQK